jgi:predicted cobalt transporter CbtA
MSEAANMLARTLTVGLLAGVLAGALVSAAQMVRVVPLILEAEVFEVADHSEHSADEATWSPEDGLERTAYTVMANLVVGVGFGLLLVGAFVLAETAGRPIGTFRGLLWGLASFLVFARWFLHSVCRPSYRAPPRPSWLHASSGGSRQPQLPLLASVSSHSPSRPGSMRWHFL